MNIWGDVEGMCHAKKICAHHGKILHRDMSVKVDARTCSKQCQKGISSLCQNTTDAETLIISQWMSGDRRYFGHLL